MKLQLSYLDTIQNNINKYQQLLRDEPDKYSALRRASQPLAAPPAKISGRERELEDLRLGLRNPEKANVILLGEPGSGKTALVQGFAYNPDSTQYLTLSIDVERLAADPNGDKDAELSNGLLDLVEETKTISRATDLIVVLFIDEFHRIAMLSPTAVESLKPILEKSAINGFRIIAATTFDEYDKWITSNRALDQRLLRMDLPELTRDAVMDILKNRAKQHHVEDMAADGIYGQVYDSSKEILISNSQPRASIDILLNMIGNITKNEYMKNGKLIKEFYTAEELNLNSKYVLSRPMLNRVIRRSYGIDIDNHVNIAHIRKVVNSRVFNQTQAVDAVLARLEMSLAGFNDPTRPKISFLSTGATGVGKTELAKAVSEAMQIPLKRFDMSRYPRPEDAVEFADQLANAAWSAPNAYILIDEAEKATREAMNILLQVLDDARLTAPNNPNRVISFTGNIINLTTNTASTVYQAQSRFGAHKLANGEQKADVELIYKALSEDPNFETSVLGRIDVIVPFSTLPPNAMAKIVQKALDDNLDIVETPNRPIFVSPDIVPYIVIDQTSNDSERGGARDAKRNVKNVVIQRLATYLANNSEQRPLILRLDKTPRFRDRTIVDVNAADVVVEDCYKVNEINTYLAALGKKMGRRIVNKGCYVPRSMPMKDFLQQVANLVSLGHGSVKTTVDITKTIVIDGNSDIDVADNKRLLVN